MFHTLIYQPLYNLFILLAAWLPVLDAGGLVIIFTLIVRAALLPLSAKAYRSQLAMQRIQPKLEAIKKEYADDQATQARKVMEAYREEKMNPFSGVLVLFLQLPIIFGLYYILIRSGLPVINEMLLYSFIPHPTAIKMTFLSFSLSGGKNLILALTAAISSFLQVHFSSAMQGGGNEGLARMMRIQMKVMMPLLAFLISWQISGVVGLYWTVSNLFTLAQDRYLKKKYANPVTLLH